MDDNQDIQQAASSTMCSGNEFQFDDESLAIRATENASTENVSSEG